MGQLVADVLAPKYPDSKPPYVDTFHHYDKMTTLINLDITADIVEQFTKKIQGTAGPGGIKMDIWQE